MINKKFEIGLSLLVGIGAVMVVGWLVLGQQKTSVQTVVPNENIPTASPTSIKTYTLAEVSTHNSAASCWLVVNNNVYDVTNFSDQHPGGQKAILNNCGKDATTVFETKGGKGEHSDAAKQRLASLMIGKIE